MTASTFSRPSGARRDSLILPCRTMYRLSPGSPSENTTRPRGRVSVSSRVATGSTDSSDKPWKSPDWASTSSTARPLAGILRRTRDGARVRSESRGPCPSSPDQWGGACPVRGASDQGRVDRPAAPAALPPATQRAADAGLGERLHLARGGRAQELLDLTGGGRPAQRL